MSENNNIDDIEFIDLDDTAPIPSQDTYASDNGDFSELTTDTDEPEEYIPKHKKSSGSSLSRAERRRRRRRKLMIRRAVFLVALLVFIVSLGFLIKYGWGYYRGNKIYADVESAVFSPATPDVPKKDNTDKSDTDNSGDSILLTDYNHQALLDLNPCAVGYLQIPALDLLLPVVHPDNNDFYLSHALTKEYNMNGTLFIDCRDTMGIESQNAIIYGHYMKNGAMFGNLKKFKDADFFMEGDNRYFYFYTENKIYQYEIYSVHETPSVSATYRSSFGSSTDFLSYYNTMANASLHPTNVSITESSKTVTLSTCTTNPDIRLVVQGVRIKEIINN